MADQLLVDLVYNETNFTNFFYENGTEPNFFDVFAEQLASALNVYYTPLLIILGAIGNLVSVFVFYSSKLRLQSTSQYLSALALSDTVFLLQLLPPWLNAVQISGLFHETGFCQLFVYLSYVSCCLSAWLVVAFTLERFVAVIHPLRRTVLCTVARARYIIIALALVALTLNIPVLRFAKPSKNDCNIDRLYWDHAARFNLVDTALSFTVPLAAIVFFNSWIMVGVVRLERTRLQLCKQAAARRRPRLAAHRHAQQRLPATRPVSLTCQRAQQRVTRMLLVVSSVFVILNLPAYAMRIVAYALNKSAQEYSGRWAALQQLALMFFNSNFGINFILYCLSGQNFRRALKQAFPWIWRRQGNGARRGNSFRQGHGSSVTTASVVSNYTDGTAPCNASLAVRPSRSAYVSRWTFDSTGHYDIKLDVAGQSTSSRDKPARYNLSRFERSEGEQRLLRFREFVRNTGWPHRYEDRNRDEEEDQREECFEMAEYRPGHSI